MPARATVFERFLYGKEVTEGTAVILAKRILGLSLAPKPVIPTTIIKETGNKAPVGVMTQKEHTEANYSTDELGFNEAIFLLSSLLDQATVSTPTTNGTFTATIDATGGSFTLSFGGQTTSGIVVDAGAATAAAVKSALEGLSTIGTGNVSVTGSAGGPFIIKFINALARTSLMLTGSAAALVGLTHTITIATTAATNTRRWVIQPDQSDPDTPECYTFGAGSSREACRFPGGKIRDFAMPMTKESVSASGSILGRRYTQGLRVQNVYLTAAGGTFTLTYSSQTTGNLAFGITAANLQTALEGLSSIGIGNVSVIGANGGPFTIELIGDLLNEDVTAFTADGTNLTGTGHTIAVGYCMSGLTVTDIPYVPIPPASVDLLMGSTLLGLQAILPKHSSFNIGNRFTPVFYQNSSNPSYGDSVEEAGDPTASITTEANTAADNYINQLRRRVTRFLKIVVEGPSIEVGFNYRLAITMPFRFMNPQPGDDEGLYAITHDLQAIYDAGLGSYVRVEIDTALAAL